MRVPAIIYAHESLIRSMDYKVYEQAANVAMLPGIVQASYSMPDAHWSYGFLIGGVGFDISCGVRTILTGVTLTELLLTQKSLVDSLYRQIPAGVGSTGAITLDEAEKDAMLTGGARWAVERGLGGSARSRALRGRRPDDRRDPRVHLGACEGTPAQQDGHAWIRQSLSRRASRSGDFRRQRRHRLRPCENDVVATIHCGSRGLGHQIGSEF